MKRNTIIKAVAGGVSALLILLAVTVADSFFQPVVSPAQTPSVDLVVVEKQQHLMQLFDHGKLVKSYQVALGRGGPGPKTLEGDNKVPEGVYQITGRLPRSAFHLALHIGYPTEAQRLAATQAHVDPGGDVMIHGIRKGFGWIGSLHRRLDWTRGCVAVTDAEIEEIWRLVPDGATIDIRP